MSLARLPKVTPIKPINPAYFTVADYPWLRVLLDERERFVGRKRWEWKERISEPRLVDAPQGKLEVALGVLDRLSHDQGVGSVAPRRIRSLVFHHAALEPDREKVFAHAAKQLGISPQIAQEELFADLPDERTLMPLSSPSTSADLALACNAAIIASLLTRALRVRIVAVGPVRAVVRYVRFTGLLCVATLGETKDEVVLEISGPFALFRHTRIYGRALASLVPRLSCCNSYHVEADCVLACGTKVGRLVLRSGCPVLPTPELASFDGKVETRFARDFGSFARDWDVIREPTVVEVGGGIIFPDFELRHRITGERWLLEIVGYWTADYVRKKLAAVTAERKERLIVCIDEERCCTEEALDLDAQVIRYRRRIDPRAVLEMIAAGVSNEASSGR